MYLRFVVVRECCRWAPPHARRISGEGDAEDDAGGEAVLVGVSGIEAGVGVLEDAPVEVGEDLEVGTDGDTGVEAASVGSGEAWPVLTSASPMRASP